MARGSKTDRPIMVLLDVLGRRWALRLLWELRDAALNFRALQQAAGGISPSVLAARLKDLASLHLVEIVEAGYALTPEGRDLGALLVPLDAWAARWARRNRKRD